MTGGSIDWGSVPDWIGGLGTTAVALLFALGWFRETRMRQGETERRSVIAIRDMYLEIEQLYEAGSRMRSLSVSATARRDAILPQDPG